MYIIFIITGVLLCIYAFLIVYYLRAWNSIKEINTTSKFGQRHTTKVSIIIPARNEAANILRCLESVAQQRYPREKTEVIVVNDYSTDNTAELVCNFRGCKVKLINMSEHLGDNAINSYKKKAIELGIAASSGELIVTTDADCTATADWISCLVNYQLELNAVLLAAPVRIKSSNSLLSIFQSTDFLTLQGITGAAVSAKFHSMCNGANLAYTREAFYAVDGFKNIDQIASGDDMLLMHKIVKKYPDRFFFVKHRAAIVTTTPADTVRSFLNQRIRWASKADKYDDKRITVVLLLVYFLNLLLAILLVAGAWNISFLFCFLLLAICKTLIEYPFISTIAAFFKQRKLLPYFPFLQPFHIIYTVVAGWLGKFGTYEWKSRKVN